MKNKLMDADEWFAASKKDFYAQRVHDVISEYEVRLKTLNAMDFDDLILNTLVLFADHPPVLQSYRDRFHYVLVDEYQDTNAAQYRLVHALTAANGNLCVVGDDDQSIYGWRGADIRNIMDFEADYPNAVTIKLEQNYRSTANILSAANGLITRNVGRKAKTLWTEESAGDPIRLFFAGDEREEAAWVCDQIRKLYKTDNSYGSIAILYRMNAQSRVLEEMFMRAGIPYRVFGGIRFYDRKEVRDIIAYLRVIVNPNDDISLRRIINEPKRSIGDATIGDLSEYALKENCSLFNTLYHIPETLASRPKRCVAEFAALMDKLLAVRAEMTLTQYVQRVLDDTGLLHMHRTEDTEESRAREGNILEFLSAVAEYEKAQADATLEDFLENIALVTDLDRAVDSNEFVTLMTLHSAKGLEFPYVFITGFEEGIFPNARRSTEEKDIQEERRLCYVGITRAMKKLFISHAEKRMLHNQLSHNPPSRFLDEIPKHLIIDEIGAQSFSFGAKDTQRKVSVNPRTGYTSMGFPRAILRDPYLPAGAANLAKGTAASAARAYSAGVLQNLFTPGDRVLHKKFGEGNVTGVTGTGSDARIRIAFTAYGEKEFLLAIAPIVKVGE